MPISRLLLDFNFMLLFLLEWFEAEPTSSTLLAKSSVAITSSKHY
jgi:hypothetical protein